MQDQLSLDAIPYGYCHCGCGRQTNIIAETCRPRGLIAGEPYRYVHGHNSRRSPVDRFWEGVDKDGPTMPGMSTPCWVWTRPVTELGYGFMRVADGNALAHRFAYELLVGPIPGGLVLDHLCRHPPCVRPAHLEPVTQAVNVLRGVSPMAVNARKTHCPRGHPYSGDNLYVRAGGGRVCRACGRIYNRKRPNAAP